MSKIKMLHKRGLLTVAQPFIADVCLEVIMGSFAYGVSGDASDMDVYGICVPPPEMTFPHVSGRVPGFGPKPYSFESMNQHHIQLDDKEYDIAIYGIVNYFTLAADNNPNIVDALFVPDRCVTHCDNVGRVMRENRKKFLHKGSYHKFKGYAYTQLKKLETKAPIGKRVELVEKYGYDTKFAYHIVRLILESEQIMMEGDLDLERNKEQLKAIREGAKTLPELKAWFQEKERSLDQLYIDSKLQHAPDRDQLNQLLLVCLEEKYGSLSKLIDASGGSGAFQKLERIRDIINE